jgi:hypothetical protein
MKSMTRRTFSFAAGASLVAPSIPNLEAAVRIPRRPFGKSGIEVTRVGLGGGRFFEAVPSDEAGGELVRQAIDHGIEYIETAANYGPPDDANRSERRIGIAMKTYRARSFSKPRSTPAITTAPCVKSTTASNSFKPTASICNSLCLGRCLTSCLKSPERELEPSSSFLARDTLWPGGRFR